MQRHRVYLLSLAFGFPALVLTYVLVGRDDPVTRFGWPPLMLHLLVSGWLLLRHPHRVVAVERATLALVTALMLARMAYHLVAKDAEQAWLALSPGTFMGLVLLVVFGYVVLGTAGGLRWSVLVIGASTALVGVTIGPQAAAGQWDVLVSMLRAEAYVVVTVVFVHALARTKDDAAQAHVQAQRMWDLANRDALTGLPNRRRAEHLLTQHMSGQGRLAVLSLDIDWFKNVNDEHGHAVGDVVLHDLAAALSDAAPTGVAVTRWGGEEFLIVCPGTDLADAAALGERLRVAVAACPLPNQLRLTVSVGLACRRHDDDVDTLLGRVDALLYAAKAVGRNVVCADEPAEMPAAPTGPPRQRRRGEAGDLSIQKTGQ